MVSKGRPLVELEDIEDNKDNLRLLTEQVQTPIGIIPFVGAGLSIPFGFPSWSGFLKDQAKKAGIEEKISARLEKGEYEEAAEDLLEVRRYRAFHDAISSAFGAHHLNEKKLKGPVLHLPQLAKGPVITTNFDKVLEKVFEQTGMPFEDVTRGANVEMATQAIVQQKRFLLKIHGDAVDSTNRILTKSDYSRHYGSSDGASIDFSLPLPGLLQQMLLGRALLFLGCSLNQDRTITVLKEVSTKARSIAHYAIVEQPIPEGLFHKRSSFLSDHNIRPIWYPNGRHELIEPLLARVLKKPISAKPSPLAYSDKTTTKGWRLLNKASVSAKISNLPETFSMKEAIATFREEVVFPNECDEVAEYLASCLKMLDQGNNLLHKRYVLKPRIEILIERIEAFGNDHPKSSYDEKNNILNELINISEELSSLE